MSDLLSRLFALRDVRFGATDTALQWNLPIPAWGWLLIVLAAAALAAWSYARLAAPRRARRGLAVVRTLLLILIAAMLCGPYLSQQRESVERDFLVVMLDRSASLTVADASPAAPRREDQLRQTIARAAPTLADLAKEKNILYLGFDSAAYDLPVSPGAAPALRLEEPAGRRTALGAALDHALRRVAAKPVSGLLVISDGRSADQPSRAALRQLQARQIPVFTVPLGSAQPIADLAIRSASVPGVVFVGDLVPVTVALDASGPAPAGAKVELLDTATDRVLDSRPLTDLSDRVILTTRPEAPGTPRWSVRIVGPAPDLAPANNSADLALRVVDRPIRVAYFDGYPRWEYRYLKNLLLREKTVRSSTMLLSATRRFIQEGSDLLTAVPRTPEEWQPFDVIILGDLRAELFSAEQLQAVRDAVSRRGAGLLWIAGPGATPDSWRNTPLADLLPFSLDSSAATALNTWRQPVIMRPTPAAQRLAVLQLADRAGDPWPDVLSAPASAWSHLNYMQRIDPALVKPAAEVLALASLPENPAESSPAVLTMRYGAGRVIYVATDEIWRWRYGRGEALPERFYLPLIRLLAREALVRGGQPAVIEAAPDQALVDQAVQVTVRLLDQSLLSTRPSSLRVRVQRTPDAAPLSAAPADISTTLELAPQDAAGADSAGVYSTVWLAPEPGRYRLTPADPLLLGLDLAATVEVRDQSDELLQPQTDHALLASLSSQTGGRTLNPDQLAQLPTLLPNRQVRLLGAAQVESLWDKPIVWTLLITLLAVEWIGRRLVRLM